MTVKDALTLVLRRFKTVEQTELKERYGEQVAEGVFLLRRWLFNISTQNMIDKHGTMFGWSSKLPGDIDAATDLSKEEQTEFDNRLSKIGETK